MNSAQKATLATMPGWEVQHDGSGYTRTGCIHPDGKFVEIPCDGPSVEVITHPEGSVIVGLPD